MFKMDEELQRLCDFFQRLNRKEEHRLVDEKQIIQKGEILLEVGIIFIYITSK